MAVNQLYTSPTSHWLGDFARQYTDRNNSDLHAIEVIYKKNFGITRIQMNDDFLASLDRGITILIMEKKYKYFNNPNLIDQIFLLKKAGF